MPFCSALASQHLWALGEGWKTDSQPVNVRRLLTESLRNREANECEVCLTVADMIAYTVY